MLTSDAKSHSRPLRFQNDKGPLVRLSRETTETKKRCEKVKRQDNAYDEERKQRFFKKSHGGLLSGAPDCCFGFCSSTHQNR